MIRLLKSIAFSLLLSCLFFAAGAQQKNYGTLIMKKEDIKKYYENNVALLVFKYKKPCFASYTLAGTPFDPSDKPTLTPFKLKKSKGHHKTKLENFYKGILILSVEEMKYHGIDGSFDIYFVPVPYAKNLEAKYVSYLINDTPDENAKPASVAVTLQAHSAAAPSELAAPVFSSFTLNPSPPYRSGER